MRVNLPAGNTGRLVRRHLHWLLNMAAQAADSKSFVKAHDFLLRFICAPGRLFGGASRLDSALFSPGFSLYLLLRFPLSVFSSASGSLPLPASGLIRGRLPSLWPSAASLRSGFGCSILLLRCPLFLSYSSYIIPQNTINVNPPSHQKAKKCKQTPKTRMFSGCFGPRVFTLRLAMRSKSTLFLV